jgi:hypothetical protein
VQALTPSPGSTRWRGLGCERECSILTTAGAVRERGSFLPIRRRPDPLAAERPRTVFDNRYQKPGTAPLSPPIRVAPALPRAISDNGNQK